MENIEHADKSHRLIRERHAGGIHHPVYPVIRQNICRDQFGNHSLREAAARTKFHGEALIRAG
jgi:hypothetical protein